MESERSVEEVARNRRAGMKLVHDAASRGDPIAGALSSFLHEFRDVPEVAFEDDFMEYAEDDGWDDIRPF